MKKKKHVDRDEFKQMWLNYVSIPDIRSHFEIGREYLIEIRNELGLQPRKIRYHQKKSRCDVIPRDKLAEYIENGLTARQVAEIYKVNIATVFAYTKKHNLNFVNKQIFDLGKLRELSEQGFSDAEIAKILGCSDSNTTKWRCRLGLPSAKTKKFNMRLRRREIVSEDHQPPVKSEESLYCSTEFLESYFGKKLGG